MFTPCHDVVDTISSTTAEYFRFDGAAGAIAGGYAQVSRMSL